MLLSHSAAYHLYNEKYRSTQNGEVGICLDTNFYYPMNKNVTQEYIDKAINFKVNILAENEILTFSLQFGWFAHSIFSTEGGYPKVLRDAIDSKSEAEGRLFSRLPKFTAEEQARLIGSADFLAVNHYTSRLVIPFFMDEQKKDWKSDDDQYSDGQDPSWERAYSNWLFSVPQGM